MRNGRRKHLRLDVEQLGEHRRILRRRCQEDLSRGCEQLFGRLPVLAPHLLRDEGRIDQHKVERAAKLLRDVFGVVVVVLVVVRKLGPLVVEIEEPALRSDARILSHASRQSPRHLRFWRVRVTKTNAGSPWAGKRICSAWTGSTPSSRCSRPPANGAHRGRVGWRVSRGRAVRIASTGLQLRDGCRTQRGPQTHIHHDLYRVDRVPVLIEVLLLAKP